LGIKNGKETEFDGDFPLKTFFGQLKREGCFVRQEWDGEGIVRAAIWKDEFPMKPSLPE
jgi:hypothetical protein